MKTVVENIEKIIIEWQNSNNNDANLLANQIYNFLSVKEMQHVAVVCFDVRDFMNFIVEKDLPLSGYFSSNKCVVDDINKIKYIRINRPDSMRGYKFDKIIETEKAINNIRYPAIMHYLKTYKIKNDRN